jgi:ABC-type branched-subunit amino acid transport system permease subunit
MKKYIIFLILVVGLGIILNSFLNSYIQAIFISFIINAIMALSLNFITCGINGTGRLHFGHYQ